jgi:hypothetical protein
LIDTQDIQRQDAVPPPMPTTGVVQVDGISKRYGRQLAVDGVSFSIAPGEIVGFVGPRTVGSGIRGAHSAERVESLGSIVSPAEAAAAASVLPGWRTLRWRTACWNRYNAAGFQLLEPDFGREKRNWWT